MTSTFPFSFSMKMHLELLKSIMMPCKTHLGPNLLLYSCAHIASMFEPTFFKCMSNYMPFHICICVYIYIYSPTFVFVLTKGQNVHQDVGIIVELNIGPHIHNMCVPLPVGNEAKQGVKYLWHPCD